MEAEKSTFQGKQSFQYSAEVGAGAFFALLRFRAREREAKKRARKREEKRARKKSAEREIKKREFALFPPTTVKIRFQSPKPLGRGKAMVLSKTIL